MYHRILYWEPLRRQVSIRCLWRTVVGFYIICLNQARHINVHELAVIMNSQQCWAPTNRASHFSCNLNTLAICNYGVFSVWLCLKCSTSNIPALTCCWKSVYAVFSVKDRDVTWKIRIWVKVVIWDLRVRFESKKLANSINANSDFVCVLCNSPSSTLCLTTS